MHIEILKIICEWKEKQTRLSCVFSDTFFCWYNFCSCTFFINSISFYKGTSEFTTFKKTWFVENFSVYDTVQNTLALLRICIFVVFSRFLTFVFTLRRAQKFAKKSPGVTLNDILCAKQIQNPSQSLNKQTKKKRIPCAREPNYFVIDRHQLLFIAIWNLLQRG